MNKIGIERPTAPFKSGIDLEIKGKYVFSISILKMPVYRLFKFQLSYRCTLKNTVILQQYNANSITTHNIKVFSKTTENSVG